jgi:hypothetical protein
VRDRSTNRHGDRRGGGRGARVLAVQLSMCIALASMTTPAFADAYDAAMAHAIAAKEKAVDANDPSAWQEALRLFGEADAVRSTKDSKYELAFAAARLKEDDLAVEAYEASIAMGLTGKAKDKADAFVKEHAPKMARLSPQGPVGATITINGRLRGTVPVARPIVVFAGDVHVTVSDGKGTTIQDDLVTKPGETLPVDWSTKLAPKKTEPTTGAITVAPRKDKEVPVEDDGAAARNLGWTLLVAGGSIAIAGGITTVVAGSSLSTRRESLVENCMVLSGSDNCPTAKPDRQADAKSDVDAIATWKGVRTAGLVALGAGGTLAVVGIVRLLTAPKAPATNAAVVPRVDVSNAGFSFGFSGAF